MPNTASTSSSSMRSSLYVSSCSSVPSASRKLPVAARAIAATAAGGISIESACAARRTTLAISSTPGR